MTISDLEKKLSYTVLTKGNNDHEIVDAYTSDLLSDVMGNAQEGSVLITIQAHKNTLAVASLAGIPAIVLCNGRTAPDDMIESAVNENVAIFTTEDSQFTASWKVAELLERT